MAEISLIPLLVIELAHKSQTAKYPLEREKMSVSVLVVSDDRLENMPAQAQTLIFPHNGEIQIYHRVSNGSKGRGQAWQKVSNIEALPSTPIAYQPVATVITERDRQMLTLNTMTNLGIKALYSLETAEIAQETQPHALVVAEAIEMLTLGDTRLNDWLTDKRRANGVVITPLAKLGTDNPSEILDRVEMAQETQVLSIPVTPQAQAKTTQALVNQMVTIPDPKWANEYINRKVGGVLDFDILDNALANNINVLIEGHAGSGKTMCVQAYASARKMRYFNLACHIGLDHTQVVGRWIPTADGHFKWQDGAVTEIVRNGGVLLINEINFLPERLSTFLFGLTDYRREIQLMENGGEVIKAHPNLLIVGDMNPEYRGTRPLNQAFADRFAGARLVFPYDKTIEIKLLKSKSLLQMAEQLRAEHDKKAITTPISTRALVAFKANAERFGMDFATYCYTNGFANDTERNAVRLVLETHRENISSELGLATNNPVGYAETLIEQGLGL